MYFLRKLFSKIKPKVKHQTQTAEEMRDDPNLIQVFGEYGQEIFIDKNTWRKDILPGNIKENWNKPEELYSLIISALDDGFQKDILNSAKRLYDIDPIFDRAACIFSIVLRSNNKPSKAEKILQTYIKKHGENGVILTNLAQTQADLGKNELSKNTLWHALELDPNQDIGVEWWVAIHRDRSGESGVIDALNKLADLKDSWRAKLWLTHDILKNKDYTRALQDYNEILNDLGEISPEIMMEISGNLGNAGRIEDIVKLFGNKFNPEIHGLMAGNNLLKAYFELKDIDNARNILDKMYKLDRPDWKDSLSYWENELDQVYHNYGQVKETKELAITTLSLEWPIWAHKLSSSDSLLPKKDKNSPVVAFLSFSYESSEIKECAVKQKTDLPGLTSRSIPLFLSEQIHMTTNAKAKTFIPVASEDGSFILSSKPCPTNEIIENIAGGDADYICTGHLISNGDNFILDAFIGDLNTKKLLENIKFKIDWKMPGGGIQKLSKKIEEILSKYCKLESDKAPIKYQLPRYDLLNRYIDAISRSLAMSVATTVDSPNMLYGERAILDYLMELVIDDENSDILQLMFIGALAKNKAYKSDIYLEYQSKAEKLINKHPLNGPATEAISETMKDLYQDKR